MNDVTTLHLTCDRGTWKFDAPEHGLKAEPFVGATNSIIDRAIQKSGKDVGTAQKNGVTIAFSFGEVPPALNAVRCEFEGADGGPGRWTNYRDVESGIDGWLCPSLWHYTPVSGGPPAVINVWAV